MSVLASFDKCRKKFIYRNWPAFAELIEKTRTKHGKVITYNQQTQQNVNKIRV